MDMKSNSGILASTLQWIDRVIVSLNVIWIFLQHPN